jgi:hypothetical protein
VGLLLNELRLCLILLPFYLFFGIIFGYISKKNQTMKSFTPLFTAIVLLSLLASCKEDEPDPGKITFRFTEMVDTANLAYDTVSYENEAGNQYVITELQYFISNLTLYYNDGAKYEIKDGDGIHYIDSDIPETKYWEITDDVPSGYVDSVVFTFGLDEETNVSGLFVNPPESNMFWPDELGGGYHYMKMNGKWLDINAQLNMFNYHLGIGQTYDTTGQVTGFVQNYFKVSVYLPVHSSFIIKVNPNETTALGINMNVNSWFTTPHTWNWNYMPAMMMQNQEVMKTACENVFDVFSVGPDYVS